LNKDAAVQDPEFENLSVKDKFWSELGKKSLPDDVVEKYAHITDPVQRGKAIWKDMGWRKALTPDIKAIRKLWGTGASPGARLGARVAAEILMPNFAKVIAVGMSLDHRARAH